MGIQEQINAMVVATVCRDWELLIHLTGEKRDAVCPDMISIDCLRIGRISACFTAVPRPGRGCRVTALAGRGRCEYTCRVGNGEENEV